MNGIGQMHRMKEWCFLLLAVCLAGSLSAEIVSESAESIRFRQPDGVIAEIRRNPERTVIGIGSLVDLWYLAGGTAVGIPGVRSEETLPEAARKLPRIGGTFVTNPEIVMSLRPDLLLYPFRHGRCRLLAEQMRNTGVPTLGVDYDNYTDFAGLLDFFCRLNGNSIEKNPEAARITREVENICRSVKSYPAPSVAIVFAATAGFKLEGEKSNTGTIAKMLGAKNIAVVEEGRRITFSYERLLMENPDVICIVTMGDVKSLREKFEREITSQSAWRELRAAKSGRVHFLPSNLYLYLPGRRFPEAFRHMAKLLYPQWREEEAR